MNKDNLLKEAKRVLLDNFQPEGFTIPCKGLYPFQWKWDSGFIAIGLAHFDIEKAKSEIDSLLKSQWGNGFIPHIVFHNDSDTYFPGPDFHHTYLHPEASKKYKSSGITQPPVIGFVLEELYRLAEDKDDILCFIESRIDSVYKNHHYFYSHRDPFDEGLVYIYHNWESGTDNSPMWDHIWETMDPPDYDFERKDTTHVDASQRPTKREYDHYIHIIEIAKSCNYDDRLIAERSPFLVYDPLFNAMLLKSNESLIKLYGIIGDQYEKVEQLEKWQEKSKKSFNDKLFDHNLNAYIHYDIRNSKPIPLISSSSFTPLFAGIPNKEKAVKLIQTLQERFGGENSYLCASFDPTEERFNPKKYWRGPVWINLNWIIYRGLKRYGFDEMAERLKNETIELIDKEGFKEYFDPRKETYKNQGHGGYGGNDFSWSAALIIDLLNQ